MKSTINYRAIKVKYIIKFLFISFLFSFSINQTNAQTENKNRQIAIADFRMSAEQILNSDTIYYSSCKDLLRNYSDKQQYDSINLFYSKLISKYKNSPKPYLIRGEYWFFEYPRNPEKELYYYKKAYEIDSNDFDVNYKLAKKYYYLFQKRIRTKDKKNSARNFIKYAEKFCKIDSSYLVAFKYPLIQMHYFLGNKDTSYLFKKYATSTYPYYFPILEFAEYPKDWLRDYRVDLFFNTERFIDSREDWFGNKLKAMREKRLYLKKTDKNIFRFLWLRSFDKPYVIRIEEDKDNIMIYWKSYESGEKIIDTSKVITKQEWNNLNNLVSGIKTWGDYSCVGCINYGDDGSEWIYEYLTPNYYKIKSEWSPNKESKFAAIGLYLIKLCGLENETIY